MCVCACKWVCVLGSSQCWVSESVCVSRLALSECKRAVCVSDCLNVCVWECQRWVIVSKLQVVCAGEWVCVSQLESVCMNECVRECDGDGRRESVCEIMHAHMHKQVKMLLNCSLPLKRCHPFYKVTFFFIHWVPL